MKRYGENFTLNQRTMDAIASYMDDGIRESIHEEMAPCDSADFLAVYLDRDPNFAELLDSEFGIQYSDDDREAHKIAMKIRESDIWNDDLNRKLCELAGIGSEYETADGDSFEAVVFKAAKILNVSI